MIKFLKNGKGLMPCDKWESNCWVNIVTPDASDKDFVVNTLGAPEAFYDDIEDVDERPRIEVEDGWCFVLMRIPYKDSSAVASAPFSTVPLGIIFKDDVFISVCFYENDMIPDFEQYTRRKDIVREDNVNFTFRLLLSASVWFLKYLKQINIQTKVAERHLADTVRNEELQHLLRLEKSLLFFNTSLRGNDIVVHRLKNLRGIKDLYDPELVEDVEIESKQALETTNIYSDILESTKETYTSVISNNLNSVMKRLTTINVVLMMPTLIASFFGMNLEQGTTIFNWTFATVACISLLITVVTALIFVRKHWF
ncbi:MAG: magnesium transporter CorA family protein [Paludibacteraceae bacterium]|nr:magnesium transporter CorA family protein [Paludibacteraceae bacterium]